MPRQQIRKRFKRKYGKRRINWGLPGRTDAEAGIDLPAYALCEFQRTGAVHGHNNGAAQNASKEGNHPFRAVFTPQKNLVAWTNPSLLQVPGQLVSRICNLAIRPP
jgi:hypothetical protein